MTISSKLFTNPARSRQIRKTIIYKKVDEN